MALQVKIFGDYRYQVVESQFNEWSAITNPFILKSILTSEHVPKPDGGNSLYFTLAIFYKNQEQEEIRRD